jgi:hypothetical protein
MRAEHVATPAADALHVRIVGADASSLTLADFRRLFSGRSLSRVRRERIESSTRALALVGERVVGLAAYERAQGELRVYELACEPTLCFSAQDIIRHLLDAIELACVAGGCRRLVLQPSAVVATGPLEWLGYRLVSDACVGGWLEKQFA